jgi:hypothetical protein
MYCWYNFSLQLYSIPHHGDYTILQPEMLLEVRASCPDTEHLHTVTLWYPDCSLAPERLANTITPDSVPDPMEPMKSIQGPAITAVSFGVTDFPSDSNEMSIGSFNHKQNRHNLFRHLNHQSSGCQPIQTIEYQN